VPCSPGSTTKWALARRYIGVESLAKARLRVVAGIDEEVKLQSSPRSVSTTTEDRCGGRRYTTGLGVAPQRSPSVQAVNARCEVTAALIT